MSNQIQLNSLQPAQVEPTPQLSYLENIVDQKVRGVALTCFESFVHWFFTTLSCLYPAYDRLYQAEVANKASEQSSPETSAAALTAARTLPINTAENRTTAVASEPLSLQISAPLETAASPPSRRPNPIIETVATEPPAPASSQMPVMNPLEGSEIPPLGVEEIDTALPLPYKMQFIPIDYGDLPPGSRGQLHDYTAGNIATICKNEKANWAIGQSHFIALNNLRVVLHGNSDLDQDNYFDGLCSASRVIIKESMEHVGQIEMVKNTGRYNATDETCVIDTTKVYLRTYKNVKGLIKKEHVYVLVDTHKCQANILIYK